MVGIRHRIELSPAKIASPRNCLNVNKLEHVKSRNIDNHFDFGRSSCMRFYPTCSDQVEKKLTMRYTSASRIKTDAWTKSNRTSRSPARNLYTSHQRRATMVSEGPNSIHPLCFIVQPLRNEKRRANLHYSIMCPCRNYAWPHTHGEYPATQFLGNRKVYDYFILTRGTVAVGDIIGIRVKSSPCSL